jgi:hypothetical protein
LEFEIKREKKRKYKRKRKKSHALGRHLHYLGPSWLAFARGPTNGVSMLT